MVKRILLVVAIIILLAVIFVFVRTQPSGDISKYEQYYASDTGPIPGNSISVTFFGASTLLFDDGETQFLIDGFFSRPSMWKVLATEIESDTTLIDKILAAHKMDRVKAIFVTHTHYDHAFDIAYTARKTNAILFGSTSALNIGRGGAVNEQQLSLFKPGQIISLGSFAVQVIASKHSPGNALKDDGVIIKSPLRQPVNMKAYSEGGSFDFYIKHNERTIYVKPSPNYIEGALDSLKAEVVFIGIGTIGNRDERWQNKFYQETVGKLKPTLVIPLHWDDFFKPVSEKLVMLPRLAQASPKDFDFFIARTKADNIDFKILQGTKSMVLFKEQK